MILLMVDEGYRLSLTFFYSITIGVVTEADNGANQGGENAAAQS